MSLTSAAVVAVVALLSPLGLRLSRLRLPDMVLHFILAILIGPEVLGWAHNDVPVRVLALVGLGFLLLLSGLEIDFDRRRGPVLKRTSASLALSFALAVTVGMILSGAGLVRSPLLIAVILSATSLGIVVPVLKDAG
jgi:Kef-type K+ transport system membrane component KefB